jgi:vitamin B12 transporter
MFRLKIGFLALLTGVVLQAQSVTDLPEVVVNSPRVANPAPVGTYAMPVSVLRYEPLVDVQGRNLAEGQADIIVRGGIFENTGFRLGAVTLLDPQTGHYLAELPVAPAMMGNPTVRTGVANALASTNVTVGTILYGWKPIVNAGQVSVGAGTNNLFRADFYQGVAREDHTGRIWAADVDYARSEGDGTVTYGDHDFQRVGGRLQVRTATSQTDVFAGYQTKFFGWPNLYTPFGVYETENLQTTLVMANHRVTRDRGGHVEAGVYYRRNKDDYEYNRLVPGQFDPYQHEGEVTGFAIDGREAIGEWSAIYRAEIASDDLTSTSLRFGRYSSRELYKVSLAGEREWDAATGGTWATQFGATWDDSNRDGGRLSPLAQLSRRFAGGGAVQVVDLEYSESTQLPTYTALNSAATSGLFRGNPDLGRTISRNLELGMHLLSSGWQIDAAVFHREDDALVDWTYGGNVNAREANAVDMRTTGIEVVARREFERASVTLGYTALTKDADYGQPNVQASFYALNYARHRLTAAIVWRFAKGWELRMDNDARIQQDNSLRTIGGNHALHSALAVIWRPETLHGMELSLQADNLWNSDYQEVPAVPAAGRQVVFGANYRW